MVVNYLQLLLVYYWPQSISSLMLCCNTSLWYMVNLPSLLNQFYTFNPSSLVFVMKYLSNKLICIHEAYCLRMSLVVESIIRKKVIHGWLHLRLGYANDIWTSLSTDLSQHSGRSKMCPILKILSTGVSQGNTLIGISHSCLTVHLSLRPTFA